LKLIESVASVILFRQDFAENILSLPSRENIIHALKFPINHQAASTMSKLAATNVSVKEKYLALAQKQLRELTIEELEKEKLAIREKKREKRRKRRLEREEAREVAELKAATPPPSTVEGVDAINDVTAIVSGVIESIIASIERDGSSIIPPVNVEAATPKSVDAAASPNKASKPASRLTVASGTREGKKKHSSSIAYTPLDHLIGPVPHFLQEQQSSQLSRANTLGDDFSSFTAISISPPEKESQLFRIDLHMRCPLPSFSPSSFFPLLSVSLSALTIITVATVSDGVILCRIEVGSDGWRKIRGKFGKDRWNDWVFGGTRGEVMVRKVQKLKVEGDREERRAPLGVLSESHLHHVNIDHDGDSDDNKRDAKDRIPSSPPPITKFQRSLAITIEKNIGEKRGIVEVMDILGGARVEKLRRHFYCNGAILQKLRRQRRGRRKGKRGRSQGEGKEGDSSTSDYSDERKGESSEDSRDSDESETDRIILATSTCAISLPILGSQDELHNVQISIGRTLAILRSLCLSPPPHSSNSSSFSNLIGGGFSNPWTELTSDEVEECFTLEAVGKVVKFLATNGEISLSYSGCQVVGTIIKRASDDNVKNSRGKWFALADSVLLARGRGVLRFGDFLSVVLFWFVEFGRDLVLMNDNDVASDYGDYEDDEYNGDGGSESADVDEDL